MATRNPSFEMLPQRTPTHDELYEDISTSSDEEAKIINEMIVEISEKDEQIKKLEQHLEGINCTCTHGHANCNLLSSYLCHQRKM